MPSFSLNISGMLFIKNMFNFISLGAIIFPWFLYHDYVPDS